MTNRDIPVSPDAFLHGIIDQWDTPTAHSFVLQLAQEWGYESFSTELATKLFQQAGYEVEVTVEEEVEEDEVEDDDGWIPWKGGECPVDPDTYVSYKTRVGFVAEKRRARYLCWYHSPFVSDWRDSDIIAYKVID